MSQSTPHRTIHLTQGQYHPHIGDTKITIDKNHMEKTPTEFTTPGILEIAVMNQEADNTMDKTV